MKNLFCQLNYLGVSQSYQSCPQLRFGVRHPYEFPQATLFTTQFFIVIIFILFLSGCSADFSSSTSNKGDGKQLVLSTDKVYLSDIDSQYAMTALMIDNNGVAYIDQPFFEWSSNAENIATVDSKGLVTAVGFGETNIFVIGDGESKTVSVVVSDQVSTLSGTVRYEDREYYSGGFSQKSNYFKAVRFAKIALVNENNRILQTTYTDDEGNFSISDVLTNQYSIVVSAQTDVIKGFDLNVQDRDSDVYAVIKEVSVNSLEGFEMDIPLSSEASGAFNILDVFTNAAQFTLAMSDAPSVRLSAFWEPNNADGTYYCDGKDSLYCVQGEGVYVYSKVNADTDEYDDDVLYHEYAHYFADVLSKDDSTGGCHLLSSKDLDLRLSWSEGWGDFFPAAVKNWLSADEQREKLLSTDANLPTTAYVDTYGKGTQIFIDLDSLNQERYSTAANELAVAKILWAASQQFGMESIVEILSTYFPQLNTPVNLEAFWDGWQSVHNPSNTDLDKLKTIFNERGVYYQADIYEQDNSWNLGLRSASVGISETHFIYDAAEQDVDIVAFQVQKGVSYTVETLGLTNGADTSIFIRDGQGFPLLINGVEVENDDYDENAYYRFDSTCGVSRIHNDGNALASKVKFTAPVNGTYYAEISSTPDVQPYLSAGRYGTYDLKITTN